MASRFIAPVMDVGKGITPSDGAQLFFFETGTATPRDTYSDQAGTIANANPVIADSSGNFPDIFISGTYKVVLKDKNGVQTGFGEADPVDSISIQSEASTVFATIAALVASFLPAGVSVTTQGYTTAGDGGGATYLIKTAVEFGGTPDGYGDHALANGNVAVLQINVSVNVLQFGAVGDGVVNDTVAIEAAIQYASASVGRVSVPKGDYLIDKLDFKNRSRLAFVGAGKNQTFFKASGIIATGDAFFDGGYTTTGPYLSSLNYNTFTDFSLDANGFVSDIGMGLSQCRRSVFERIDINDFKRNLAIDYCWLDTFNDIILDGHTERGLSLGGTSVNAVTFNNLSTTTSTAAASNIYINGINQATFNTVTTEGAAQYSFECTDFRVLNINGWHHEGEGTFNMVSYTTIINATLNINGALFFSTTSPFNITSVMKSFSASGVLVKCPDGTMTNFTSVINAITATLTAFTVGQENSGGTLSSAAIHDRITNARGLYSTSVNGYDGKDDRQHDFIPTPGVPIQINRIALAARTTHLVTVGQRVSSTATRASHTVVTVADDGTILAVNLGFIGEIFPLTGLIGSFKIYMDATFASPMDITIQNITQNY